MSTIVITLETSIELWSKHMDDIILWANETGISLPKWVDHYRPPSESIRGGWIRHATFATATDAAAFKLRWL